MNNNSELRWRKTDESDWLEYFPEHIDHTLIYGRIYNSLGSYNFSTSNQLICNLKIPINASKQRLKYKSNAIEKFKYELLNFFKKANIEKTYHLVPMPPSKMRNNIEYDDRIEQVAAFIAKNCSNICFSPFLITKKDLSISHLSHDKRDPELIYEALELKEFQTKECDVIIILDDVLTSGAHFKASYQRLREKFLHTKIVGIFWAKAVQDPSFLIDSIEFDQ